MSGAIEEAAKKFLVDPAYHKVFKHTFDVVEDYVCGLLIATGAIALSVRFLSALGTGDAVCIILGVQHSNGTFSGNELFPFPSGATLSMVTYANFNQRCVDACLTKFMQYSPFILLIEAMLVIMAEKFFLKIPRVAGKIERFYINIVEESLFGKDPDVAEDVCDDKSNIEAISRRRRRNEVCMSLKRSSIIHQMYVFKNIMEMVLLLIFIPINMIFAIEAEKNKEAALCEIDMKEISALSLGEGSIHFQCEGKKVHFFIIIIYINIVFQICCIICSFGSLVWCLFFRSVSKLLKNIERSQPDYGLDLEKNVGEDFLFLFDLLAHSSGIESTLRVLTHSDDTFRRICLPRLKVDSEHILVEEDKLKIIWGAAGIERWLQEHTHREIKVDSYDVTIFPAESIKNTVSKKAKLKYKNLHPEDDEKYSAWFFDLAGGKTEYIVTIACVIGRSRMKGERIVTNLLPYGAEKPRGGILKSAGTQEIEISWEPPKGDFTKYTLTVEPYSVDKPKIDPSGLPALRFDSRNSVRNVGSYGDLTNQTSGVTRRDISSKMTSFTVSGLLPGEIYGIHLKSKTGDRETRQPIEEVVLTKPERVTSVSVSDINTEKALLKWVSPEGHMRLKAFNVLLNSKDNKSSRELAVKHNTESLLNSFLVENLPPATEFSVTITTVCVWDKLKTLSDEEKVVFMTLPFPARNLELETRLCNSFQVKWESSTTSTAGANHKFKLNIQSSNIGYNNSYEVGGDRHTFNFSKLPDVIGTGEVYTIKITYCVQPTGSDSEVESEPLSGTFLTKPLPPTNFKIGPGRNQISWTRSQTPNVSMYKLRYKSVEEGSRSEELLIPADNLSDPCTLELEDLYVGVQYRINIYGVVDIPGMDPVESKELHEKIIMTDPGLVIYSEELERADSNLSRQISDIMQ